MCKHLKLGVQDCLPCTVGQLVHGMFMTSYSYYLCTQTVMLDFCACTDNWQSPNRKAGVHKNVLIFIQG